MSNGNENTVRAKVERGVLHKAVLLYVRFTRYDGLTCLNNRVINLFEQKVR